MGQLDSRYGGGPGLNSITHSLFGPKCSLAESPDKCSPVGLAVTGWTRRVSVAQRVGRQPSTSVDDGMI